MKTVKDGRLAAKCLAALFAGLCHCAFTAHAQIAFWSFNPVAGDDFNNRDNWFPPRVPTDIAIFGLTLPNGRSPLILANTTLSQILFTGSGYSIGVIGPNSLELTGGGFLNLSSNNQVVVVTSGGTLTFAGGSTAGNDTIGYSNRNGAIIFNNSSAGSANFENESGGIITFINGHAGNAIISNNFGAATINFQGASTADNATISNFTVAGGGSIVFTGSSSAGNATITNFSANDSITFTGFSNAGSATIATNSGSTINFTGASTGAIARFIVNSGGVFDMSALVTYGMSTGSIEGAGEFFLGSKLLFTGLNDLSTEVSGVIADGGMANGTGGELIKVGSGTLTLLGTNTYSGGTRFDGGVVAVERDANLGTGPLSFNGGTLEALASGGGIISAKTVKLNIFSGTFLADAGTTSVLNGVISGSGSFTKDGPGELILTANNTYASGTTIREGTLQLGNGIGTNGSIVGNVVDNGTLVFFHGSGQTTFPGVISGSGSLIKAGDDTLLLTANNSFEDTIIKSGTLVTGTPNASQAISFALGRGDVFLQGGTLRTPSLDPVVINVGRDYTESANGTLALGVAGLDGSQYDHVQVGRDASLNGTLSVTSLNNFRPSNGNAFEVLRSNGTTSGQFSNIVDNLNNNPGLQRVDVYAKNGVALVYIAVVPPPPGVTPPPITEEDPEPLPPVEPDAPLTPPEVVTILDPTAEQLTSLYEVSFSGANMQRFNLGDRMFQIQEGTTGFVSPIAPAPPPAPTGKEITEGKGVEGKAPAPAPQPGPTNRWGIWANGWGDFVNLDSTSAAQGYNFTTGGISAGVDYLITDHFAVGLFGGYSHTWVNFNPSGSADVNTGRGGLYATYFQQGWWINAAVWGGGNSYSTSRQAVAGQANGETDGWELSTFGDAGYDFHCGDLSFGPTVSMQYTDVHISGFGEHGSLVPLNIHGDSQDSLRTDVGGQAYYKWHVGNIPVIPNVRLAWEHEYEYANLPITATAPILNGATTTFYGPNEGHDSMIINANIAVQWTQRIWTTIGYDGQVARDNYNSNAVTGTFSFSF